MQVYSDASAVLAQSRAWRRAGESIALVPTMGALHEGHLSLVRLAQKECARVIVTIFVNPAQFSPSEDLSLYPRTLETDLTLLDGLGTDAVFTPSEAGMYRADHSCWVLEERLALGLCGASRPTHFRGVTTIVSKLFNITEPDFAIFGQKDYQQARVIERMVRDLDYPIRIVLGPIVREEDGLAMSSRNRLLSAEDRARAVLLSRTLFACRQLAESGAPLPEVRGQLDALLAAEPRAEVDYAEILHPDTLQPVESFSEGALIALAVRFASVRLIDNIVIRPLPQ